jgi:hypothetical protein
VIRPYIEPLSYFFLLVPVPFVYLADFEADQVRHPNNGFLIPIRVLHELIHQYAMLLIVLSLSLSLSPHTLDDEFFLRFYLFFPNLLSNLIGRFRRVFILEYFFSKNWGRGVA